MVERSVIFHLEILTSTNEAIRKTANKWFSFLQWPASKVSRSSGLISAGHSAGKRHVPWKERKKRKKVAQFRAEQADNRSVAKCRAWNCATWRVQFPLSISFRASRRAHAKKMKRGAYAFRIFEVTRARESPREKFPRELVDLSATLFIGRCLRAAKRTQRGN